MDHYWRQQLVSYCTYNVLYLLVQHVQACMETLGGSGWFWRATSAVLVLYVFVRCRSVISWLRLYLVHTISHSDYRPADSGYRLVAEFWCHFRSNRCLNSIVQSTGNVSCFSCSTFLTIMLRYLVFHQITYRLDFLMSTRRQK